MKVFLDLEDTCITMFNTNFQLCNVDKVKQFIHTHNVKEVSIFSAAIWDDSDVTKFNENIKSLLEDTFKVKIVDCINMKEVWKKTSLKSIHCDWEGEITTMVGKDNMFIVWVSEKVGKVPHSVLLDDSFGNRTIVFHDSQIQIDIVDVNNQRKVN